MVAKKRQKTINTDRHVRPSREDLEDGDLVTILRDAATGSAFFGPRSIRNGTPEQLEIYEGLQACARQIVHLQGHVDELVMQGRELGASWDAMGWCVNLTGEALRRRLGDSK